MQGFFYHLLLFFLLVAFAEPVKWRRRFRFYTCYVYTRGHSDILTSFRSYQRARCQLNITFIRFIVVVGSHKNAAPLRKPLLLTFFSPRAGKPISMRHPLSSYHLDFPLPQLVPSHFSPGFCLPWNNPVFGDNAYGDSSWRANYTTAQGFSNIF